MAIGLVTAYGGEPERKEPLPIKEGGTGAATVEQARKNLGVASSDHTHNLNDLVTGSTNWSGATIPVDKGGTGATTATQALTNLGAASAGHTHALSDLVTGSTNWPGATIPVDKGGTGATTATQALTNLGAASAGHTHALGDLVTGSTNWPGATIPVDKGGTGATTPAQALTNLGAASAGHTHALGDLVTGSTSWPGSTISVNKGGTGATTAEQARDNLGAAPKNHTHTANDLIIDLSWLLPLTGGTMIGPIKFGSDAYYINADGTANFQRAYGAVWNDYAEFFPRGGETEPGDIVALDMDGNQESYSRATNLSRRVAGVHSDEYAYLIGGEPVGKGEDYEKKNLKKFIPVALAGRVRVRVKGPVSKGDLILPSDEPGVGRAALACESPAPEMVVGYAVESDDRTDVRRLRVRVKGW